ncbi:MAG: hypothetical protein HZA10_07105 [Nitrospirae bacterium]|nr:hypothetical protein [Nitrospirota bacterium]
MQAVAIFTIGLTSILMQITALRQLLSVFSGNELDIGITLSVWLIITGIGSYAGRRLKSIQGFALSFFAVALFVQLTVLFISLIRPCFSIGFGETIPLGITLIATVITLLPLCMAVGMQFPLAVSHTQGKTAKVYGIEAAGAFTGGILFVLLLSGRVNALTLSLSISILNCIIALLLIKKRFLIALLLIPLALYAGINRIDLSLLSQLKGLQLIKKVESRYGEIAVLKIREQFNVYSLGKFQFSYPDPQTEEIKAHLTVSAHPSQNIQDVIVIGGSPSVLREFLKYSASRIDFIEIDPEMINVSFGILSPEDRNILNDKRLRIITADARKFIKTLQNTRYDLVVLNLPEPSTAGINRFYTVEFFKEAHKVLRQGGMLSLSLPTSSGYVGKRMQIANGSVFNSLKSVFKNVSVSSEEYGIMLASDSFMDTRPEMLESRFSKKIIGTKYFHPYIIKDAFSPLKVRALEERLGKTKAVNNDLRPAAYLYNLMLWAEAQKIDMLMSVPEYEKWLIAAAIIMLITAVFVLRKKVQSAHYSIFTTGYSAMAFSIVIILTYQSAFGYIYEMIGILTATFMAGIAAGAYITKHMKKSLFRLKTCEVLTILLLITSPLFFKDEFVFYLLSFSGGLIAGAEFVAANKFLGEIGGLSNIAGKLYALDLAGSFLGAFLTAIFFVPLLGIQNTLLFVALLKLSSLALLFSIKEGI